MADQDTLFRDVSDEALLQVAVTCHDLVRVEEPPRAFWTWLLLHVNAESARRLGRPPAIGADLVPLRLPSLTPDEWGAAADMLAHLGRVAREAHEDPLALEELEQVRALADGFHAVCLRLGELLSLQVSN